jgi:hypothetical protein
MRAAPSTLPFVPLARKMIFVHFDGDDIGSALELLLLDDCVEGAREYSASVTQALALVRASLASHGDADIFVSGGDDLVVMLPEGKIDMRDVEQLRAHARRGRRCARSHPGQARRRDQRHHENPEAVPRKPSPVHH